MTDLDAARAAAVRRIEDKENAEKPPYPPASSEDLARVRRALVTLIVFAVGVVMWAAQDILVPTAMAVVLALVLTPIVAALERLRIPTGLASALVVLFAAGALAGGAYAVAPGVANWIKRAPEIGSSIEAKLQPLKGWITTYESASDELAKITDVSKDKPGTTVVAVPKDDATVLEVAPAVFAQMFYVVVLALFLIGGRDVYRKRLIMLATDRADRLRVAHILSDSLEQVSEYLFTMMCVSVGLTIVAFAAFVIAGIDNALLWAVLFGVGSIIPYLGPTVAILGCALVQFATQPTLGDAAVGPLILLAINTIESNFVTPHLVSRRVGVSALAIFVAIAVLVWMWGAAASILAVPLLILFHAIARNIESLKPYAVLLMEETAEATASDAKTPTTWRDYFAGIATRLGLRKAAVDGAATAPPATDAAAA